MAFFYHQGKLKIGTNDVFADVEEIVRQDTPGPGRVQPTYVYDLDDVKARFTAMKRVLEGLNASVHYAMKANSHLAILKIARDAGCGVDTVSGGEIRRALEAGIQPTKIIFSGVAKTVAEIEFALAMGIKQINVESPAELERIAAIAGGMRRAADVAFRLNPDVNPQTHPYITTGFRENKFGMDESFVPELVAILRKYPSALRLRGLTMHIGSLLFDLDVIREAIVKTLAVHRRLAGEGFALDRLDIGGGLGIRYETSDTSSEATMMAEYGHMARETIGDLAMDAGAGGSKALEILTEPGRILVGRAGLLVGEVQYVKTTSTRSFLILNTGMNHLIRPALYGAKHRILPLKEAGSSKNVYDVVGPICESSDFLAKGVELGEVRQGDLVAIADAGAYGFAMASAYNSHDLPREIPISLRDPGL